ncbi:MAG: 5-formyltetrahydrofolate cyclo-ligase [Chloroflexota bacterium]
MPVNNPELKKQLRQNCREKRAALGEDFQHKASLMICRHIETWSFFQDAGAILAYLPMRDEVDLLSLLENNPQKNWLIPRIQPHGHMDFHPYVPGRLIRHRYGMLEPDPALPVIPADQVELVLTPGLAYDRHGWRLGYGGGFYDRFLSRQHTLVSLGVTYQALLLPDLPHLEYDVPVKYLVTENGVESSSNHTLE